MPSRRLQSWRPFGWSAPRFQRQVPPLQVSSLKAALVAGFKELTTTVEAHCDTCVLRLRDALQDVDQGLGRKGSQRGQNGLRISGKSRCSQNDRTWTAGCILPHQTELLAPWVRSACTGQSPSQSATVQRKDKRTYCEWRWSLYRRGTCGNFADLSSCCLPKKGAPAPVSMMPFLDSTMIAPTSRLLLLARPKP